MAHKVSDTTVPSQNVKTNDLAACLKLTRQKGDWAGAMRRAETSLSILGQELSKSHAGCNQP